jgi:hypothetical protein
MNKFLRFLYFFGLFINLTTLNKNSSEQQSLNKFIQNFPTMIINDAIQAAGTLQQRKKLPELWKKVEEIKEQNNITNQLIEGSIIFLLLPEEIQAKIIPYQCKQHDESIYNYLKRIIITQEALAEEYAFAKKHKVTYSENVFNDLTKIFAEKNNNPVFKELPTEIQNTYIQYFRFSFTLNYTEITNTTYPIEYHNYSYYSTKTMEPQAIRSTLDTIPYHALKRIKSIYQILAKDSFYEETNTGVRYEVFRPYPLKAPECLFLKKLLTTHKNVYTIFFDNDNTEIEQRNRINKKSAYISYAYADPDKYTEKSLIFIAMSIFTALCKTDLHYQPIMIAYSSCVFFLYLILLLNSTTKESESVLMVDLENFFKKLATLNATIY